MADESYDRMKKQFDEMKRQTSDMLKQQQDLEQGLGNYVKVWQDIREIQKDILHVQQQKKAAEEDLAKYEAKISKKRERWMKLAESGNKKVAESAKKRLAVIEAELDTRKANVKILAEEGAQLEKNLDTTKKMVRESNYLKAAFKTTGNFVKKWGFDKLKEYGVFDMDKEIRNAARSMGVGNNQYAIFSSQMQQAADSTTMIGVNLKQLAKLQKGYSEQVGRTVRLSEDGYKAMAGMVEGTGLGEEFAIGMAGAMDNFGVGVESSAQLVEDTMNIAGEMGVNASKAAKTLQQNLKFAQKYNFKGGVKALGKMSADALRLKLDMDGIAGVAEKVFRPEGAIEMAAQLSIMGGEFAKLGDPMQLMFKARNDFEGFAKDIGKATSEFVEYNKESGEFELKGGLAADRMREISKMTGIAVDKLQEMAVQQKKLETIGSISPVSMTQEEKELMASIADVGKDGEFRINFGDEEGKLIKEMDRATLDKIKAEKQTLDERAEQSRTALEDLKDIGDSLKQLLIPIAEELKDSLGVPLKNLLKDWKKNGFYKSIRGFVKTAASLAGSITKFVLENPIATLVGTLATWGALKAATWYMNGKMLGMGFNSVASAGGGGGGIMDMLGMGRNKMGFLGGKGRLGGMGKMLGGGSKMFRGKGSMVGRGLRNMTAKSMGATGGFMKGGGTLGKLGKAAKFGKGMFGPLAIAGLAADVGRGFLDDPDSKLGKGLGIGGAAATGAGLGSMLGPIGTLVGGLLGAGYGTYQEFFADNNVRGGNRNFSMDDGIIKFNPKDKFTKVDDATMIAGTNVNGNKDLAKAITGNSTVKHTHEDQTITIRFEGISEDIAKKIVDEPEIRRKINNALLAERANVGSGGKMSPNPKFV